MSFLNYWISFVSLTAIACLLVSKGLQLWVLGTDVDGDGIGISLLGIEINDTVPEESIRFYSSGFFAASALFFAAGLLCIMKIGKRQKN